MYLTLRINLIFLLLKNRWLFLIFFTFTAQLRGIKKLYVGEKSCISSSKLYFNVLSFNDNKIYFHFSVSFNVESRITELYAIMTISDSFIQVLLPCSFFIEEVFEVQQKSVFFSNKWVINKMKTSSVSEGAKIKHINLRKRQN